MTYDPRTGKMSGWIQQNHPVNSPKPTRQILILRISEDGWDPILSGIAACLEKISKEIPQWQRPDSWDGLQAEIWPSSGKIVLATSRYGYRGKDKIAVQLQAAFLQDLFDQLPDPEEDSPEFDRQISQLETKLRSCFLTAVDQAKPALQALNAQHPFELFVQSSDDLDTRMKVPFL